MKRLWLFTVGVLLVWGLAQHEMLTATQGQLQWSQAQAKHYSDDLVACLNGNPLVLSDDKGPVWVMKCTGAK
jgi:hypothetical protein